MACFHNTNYNPCKVGGLSLRIVPPLNNPIKKLPTYTKLHNNMNSHCIFKSTHNRYHIGMPCQMVHNLNLPPNILHIFPRRQLPLGNRFTCKLFPIRLLHAKVRGSKLPLPQLSAQTIDLLQILSVPLQHRIYLKPCTGKPLHMSLFFLLSRIPIRFFGFLHLSSDFNGFRRGALHRHWGIWSFGAIRTCIVPTAASVGIGRRKHVLRRPGSPNRGGDRLQKTIGRKIWSYTCVPHQSTINLQFPHPNQSLSIPFTLYLQIWNPNSAPNSTALGIERKTNKFAFAKCTKNLKIWKPIDEEIKETVKQKGMGAFGRKWRKEREKWRRRRVAGLSGMAY